MKRKFLGVILAALVAITSQPVFAQSDKSESVNQVQFSDIADHWSKDSIQYLMNKNAVPFNEGNFLPNKAVERSEFAYMLHEALDIQVAYFVKPEIKDYFDDVDENAKYAASVMDLSTLGVFQGEKSFNPEGTLTREEMIHYIMQVYKYKTGLNYALIKIKPSTFSDIDSVKSEYNVDVALAQNNKIIFGTGDNNFEPHKQVTRAEAAAVISRLSQVLLLEGKEKRVTVEPDAIMTEDSIEMKIVINNNTDEDVVINGSSGQKFDFQLLDINGETLYTWSADKMFTMALTDYTVKAGESLVYSDTLSGEAYKNIKDKIVSMRAYLTGTSDFINPDGYTIPLRLFAVDNSDNK